MKVILIVIAGILATSCSRQEKSGSLTIEEDKMVDILFDVRIMDDQIKRHHVLDRDSVGNMYLSMICNIHQIPEEELTRNLSIIQHDPVLARRLENKVIEKMVEINKSLNIDDGYDE